MHTSRFHRSAGSRLSERQHSGAFGTAVLVFLTVLLAGKALWTIMVPLLTPAAAALPWSTAALVALLVAAMVFFVVHPRSHQRQAARHTSDVSEA